MSAANDHQSVGEQGRFGPPPLCAFSVTAMRHRDGTWTVVCSQRREGAEFARTLRASDLTLQDLVEAVCTEANRLYRG